MQKRKSFLMKLLVLLTVVFCTFALAFGMVGCAADGKDGANGKDGKDGVSIESVYINEDGELVIKLTDGTEKNAGIVKGDKGDQGGTFDSECDCDYVMHEVRTATCTQEQILLNICTKCNGYEVVVGEKNSNNHVKYEWVQNDAGFYVEEETKDITDHPQTELEIAMKACPEQTCNLCKADLKAHAETEEVPVFESNPCTAESLVIDVCVKCGVHVSEIHPSPAKGHSFEYASDDYATAGCKEFNVTLKCKDCPETTVVKAVKDAGEAESVKADCLNGGYDEYEYSFNNGLKKGVDVNYAESSAVIKKNETGATGEHVLTNGTYTLGFKAYDDKAPVTEEYTVERQEALDALFADETIAWNVDKEPNCKDANFAVFTCGNDECGKTVIIKLNFKHNYVETKKTCTDDGKYTCSECNGWYTADDQKATGHVWGFKSFNASAQTITVECSVCKGTETVNAVRVPEKDVEAENCQSKAYEAYKTTGLTNGVDLAKEVVIEHKHEVFPELQHSLRGTEFKFYAFSDTVGAIGNRTYDFDPRLADFFDDNDEYKLSWNNGDPGDCMHSAYAVYKCDDCNKSIVISLKGEHQLTGDPTVNAPGCDVRGTTTKKCSVCTNDVVIDSVDAKGHTFVADETSWNAFIADPDAGDIVKFVCKCTETTSKEINLEAKIKSTADATGCVTGKIYTFEFKHEYKVQAALDEDDSSKWTLDKVFTKTYEYSDTTGTHRVGDWKYTITSANTESTPEIEALIDAGKITWNIGKPGNCTEAKLAVFKCEDCGVTVVFNLKGHHEYDVTNTDVKHKTCTEDGWTKTYCTACKTYILTATDKATGHELSWKFTTNMSVANNVSNPGVYKAVCNAELNAPCTYKPVALAKKVDAQSREATCCYAGVHTYEYYHDVNANGVIDSADVKVHTDSIVMPITGDHDFNPAKLATYVDFDAKVVYVFVWCYNGNGQDLDNDGANDDARYVLVAKYNIADGACADAENHELTEVYNNGEIKVVVCGDEEKAFIVEIKK
ncbi:MAG: hypothetical protein E7373_01515 [Clostridiales bacterium]|nr:hypothetical protein [Clostridiales bacterium]